MLKSVSPLPPLHTHTRQRPVMEEMMAANAVQQQQQQPQLEQFYCDSISDTSTQDSGLYDELPSQRAARKETASLCPNSPIDQHQQDTMRKMVNKLGGTYCSGKPLSLTTRRQIVAMAQMGMKACDISRQLQISHGCVSKIIAKWRSTGSFAPRRIGGSKPKKTIGDVVAAVRMYKRSCPSIRSLEIRHRLLTDGICTEYTVPSLSSINRIIRMKLREDLAEFEATAVRDLMAILATAAVPADGSRADSMELVDISDATSDEPEVLAPPQPESSQVSSDEEYSPPITENAEVAEFDHAVNYSGTYNLPSYEGKLQSLPASETHFPTISTSTNDRCFDTDLNVPLDTPNPRNYDASNNLIEPAFTNNWNVVETCPAYNWEHGGLNDPCSTSFVQSSDSVSLNFDDTDLWSLFDEFL